MKSSASEPASALSDLGKMPGPPPYFLANLKCVGIRKIIFQAVTSNMLVETSQ